MRDATDIKLALAAARYRAVVVTLVGLLKKRGGLPACYSVKGELELAHELGRYAGQLKPHGLDLDLEVALDGTTPQQLAAALVEKVMMGAQTCVGTDVPILGAERPGLVIAAEGEDAETLRRFVEAMTRDRPAVN